MTPGVGAHWQKYKRENFVRCRPAGQYFGQLSFNRDQLDSVQPVETLLDLDPWNSTYFWQFSLIGIETFDSLVKVVAVLRQPMDSSSMNTN